MELKTFKLTKQSSLRMRDYVRPGRLNRSTTMAMLLCSTIAAAENTKTAKVSLGPHLLLTLQNFQAPKAIASCHQGSCCHHSTQRKERQIRSITGPTQKRTSSDHRTANSSGAVTVTGPGWSDIVTLGEKLSISALKHPKRWKCIRLHWTFRQSFVYYGSLARSLKKE